MLFLFLLSISFRQHEVKMLRVLLVVATLVCSLRVAGADVVAATEKDFDNVVTRGEIALVKFYAPWCGHCKNLAPEWEKAAKEVPSEVIMVDVDCTTEKALAQKYSIKGFPTIILFREGEVVETYSGARQSDDIVSYARANVGPSVTYVSDAQTIKDMKNTHGALCVGVTSGADTVLSKAVIECAKHLRTKMKFMIVTDPNVLTDEKPETVVVYRTGDEREVYDGKMVAEELKPFLEKALIPFAGEITPQTYRLYAETSLPVGWVLLDAQEASLQLKDKLLELGKKMRPHSVLLWVDTVKHNVARNLKFTEDPKYPAFVIVQEGKNYLLPPSEPATLESIEEFILEYSRGNLVAAKKTQPVPEVETVDGLTTIVGSTMDKYLSSGKDILIEFFAPWCGHCKEFAHTYSKVAKEFEPSDVIIAAMDATANDVDESMFDVPGFPTLYFVPYGKKPILFDGDRTFLDVYRFVRQHSTTFVSDENEKVGGDLTEGGKNDGAENGDL